MFDAVFRLGSLRTARLVPAFLAVVVFVASATAFLPRTEAGRHCPLVEAQRASRSQSDTIGAESRSPKPGDADFQQCRCSEEKSGAAKLAGGPCAELPPAMLPANPAGCSLAPAVPRHRACEDAAHGPDAGRMAPPTPPPVNAP